jgi:hypothetical protein
MTTELPLTSDIRAIYADAEDFGFGTSANYASRAEGFDAWLEATIAAARAQGFAEGRENERAKGAVEAVNEVCLDLDAEMRKTPISDDRSNGIQSGLSAALKIASKVAQKNLDLIPGGALDSPQDQAKDQFASFHAYFAKCVEKIMADELAKGNKVSEIEAVILLRDSLYV